MSSATGQEIKAAFKKAATWGTAVACGALDGVLIRAGGGHTLALPSYLDDSLGMGWPSSADPGEVSAGAEFNSYLRYDSLDLLIAMAMGAGAVNYGTPKASGTASGAGTKTTLVDTGAFASGVTAGDYVRMVQGSVVSVRKITVVADNQITWVGDLADATDGSTTWKIHDPTLADATHVYTLAESVDGQFITSAIDNTVNVDELPTAKVLGFTIKGQVGQPLEFNFKLLGIERVFDSSTNTLVTMANVTFREARNRALFSHSVFRMNAQDGDALDSGDVVYPSSFELTFERKLAGMYGQGGSFDKIDEPSVDGFPTISLKLEFPRYTDATHFTNWQARDEYMKLDLTLTGSSGRSIFLEFPNLQYVNVDLPITESTLRQPVEFVPLSCTAAPNGMSGLTTPFRLTAVNTFGGNPLEVGN